MNVDHAPEDCVNSPFNDNDQSKQMLSEKGSVVVKILTEKQTPEATKIIDEVAKLSGETFSFDPTIRDLFTEPIARKVFTAFVDDIDPFVSNCPFLLTTRMGVLSTGTYNIQDIFLLPSPSKFRHPIQRL